LRGDCHIRRWGYGDAFKFRFYGDRVVTKPCKSRWGGRGHTVYFVIAGIINLDFNCIHTNVYVAFEPCVLFDYFDFVLSFCISNCNFLKRYAPLKLYLYSASFSPFGSNSCNIPVSLEKPTTFPFSRYWAEL